MAEEAVTAPAGSWEPCSEDVVGIRPVHADAPTGHLRVGQLHRLLHEAARSSGLGEVWVTGTVTGLRAEPRFTNLELVDYEPDGSTVHAVLAVLAVGMFASHARQVRNTLASAGDLPRHDHPIGAAGSDGRGLLLARGRERDDEHGAIDDVHDDANRRPEPVARRLTVGSRERPALK